MSANNGQRARFQRDRKRRVLLRMRTRAVMVELKNKLAAGAVTSGAPPPKRRRAGPALESK